MDCLSSSRYSMSLVVFINLRHLRKLRYWMIKQLAQGHTAKWKKVEKGLQSWCFTTSSLLQCVLWFEPPNYPVRWVFSFYRLGNWGSLCLRNLPRVAKLASVWDKIPTQIFLILKLLFFLSYHSASLRFLLHFL